MPVSWMVVALAMPAALAASSRLAAVSATSSVAPAARAKFGFVANVSACAAETLLPVPTSWSVVALPRTVALAASRLAAVSAMRNVAPAAKVKFGSATRIAACATKTMLLVPVSCTEVAFPRPLALVDSSRLAAVSATSKVAPLAKAKLARAARLLAFPAVTVLDVPVSVTEVSLPCICIVCRPARLASRLAAVSTTV